MDDTNHRIAIVGVGPSISRSLAIWLASLGWSIALLSRNEQSLSKIAEDAKKASSSKTARIVYTTVDASQPESLRAALDWSCNELGGKLDVLSHNAARVAGSDILSLTPEELETDFRVSAVSTLVAGQWFASEARRDFAEKGELPLFLVTGGILDREPEPSLSSLCAAKAASQTISRLFAKVLPERSGVLVGMPLVAGRIMDPDTGEYVPGYHPDEIVRKLFAPFFRDREDAGKRKDKWVVERVL